MLSSRRSDERFVFRAVRIDFDGSATRLRAMDRHVPAAVAQRAVGRLNHLDDAQAVPTVGFRPRTVDDGVNEAANLRLEWLRFVNSRAVDIAVAIAVQK